MGLGKATLSFTKFAHEKWELPKLPTFIVMGRSNVGKSSLLNALVHPQRIFKTGSTPGVTRGLVGAEVAMGKKSLFILDLPGWGYAIRSSAEIREWEDLGKKLLKKIHQPLTKVFWLLDPRRKPDDMDALVSDWMMTFNHQVIFTKADQVIRSKRKEAEGTWSAFLGESFTNVNWMSAKTGEGLDDFAKFARSFVRDVLTSEKSE
jgi:GTP-binding protein